MNKYNFFSGMKSVFALLLIVTVSVSCSNSTSGDDEHEHEDPYGFLVRANGQIILQQLPDEGITGEIELEAGVESEQMTVYFLNHDGEEIEVHADEGYSLEAEFDPNGVVEFQQNEDGGPWSFNLYGETEGQTTMNILLMHNGHDDFTSANISVHVQSHNE